MSDQPVVILQADAERLPLADRSVDLVFGSPPYCDARTYGINAQRGCEEWVDWMLRVSLECQRICKGPVIWVVAGVTRDRCYWPAPEGLKWEWWKRGGDCELYHSCFWYAPSRTPGSGGDDWFRADVTYVICLKRRGPLPWSDNTAMGHPPKWAPGGEMSHRLSDGERRNQWGGNVAAPGAGRRARRCDGSVQKKGRSSHRPHTMRRADGKMEEQKYVPPVLANPGNLIRTNVGGGHLGDKITHENEAPFPEKLAEWFVRSLCPPGGTVLDPFCGSGTTAKVALALGRKAIAVDIRASQCELTKRRIAEVQLEMA